MTALVTSGTTIVAPMPSIAQTTMTMNRARYGGR